jgi:hypothetical protein
MGLAELLELKKMIDGIERKIAPKKYRLYAYVERSMKTIADSIEMDDLTQADAFIKENCALGYTCTIVNNETNTREIFYKEQI